MRFIGDIHGYFSTYVNITERFKDEQTVQIGDMGVGFPKMPELPELSKNHRWFRGNHDSPEVARKHPNYLKDFGWVEEFGIFVIAGGLSIDKHLRREGVGWWRDEQLNATEMLQCYDEYVEHRPKVVASHECPVTIQKKMHPGERLFGSETARFLDILLDVHQPDYWVFGHHHMNFNTYHDNTLFVCVGELQNWELPNGDNG